MTQTLNYFTEDINGVETTLVDTPGFSDISKPDEHIIIEIRKQIGKESFDLILFCVRMDGSVQSDDFKIMELLTHEFGQSIWEHAVFVLTFANQVKEDNFAKILADWDKSLHEYARTKGGVGADIAKQIPVVVAGNEQETLPGCENWFSQFWAIAFEQTKNSAKPAYLSLTLGLKMTDNSSFSSPCEFSESTLGRRMLMLQEGLQKGVQKSPGTIRRQPTQPHKPCAIHHFPMPDSDTEASLMPDSGMEASPMPACLDYVQELFRLLIGHSTNLK